MQKTSATLLIIDDDDVVRASLAAYLEDSGFSVLQAGNGQLVALGQRCLACIARFGGARVRGCRWRLRWRCTAQSSAQRTAARGMVRTWVMAEFLG